MDAREFYSQIDQADDELKAAEIEDEDKRDRFETVLFYLSSRLNEISEECYKLSAEIDNVREYDLSELVIEADEIAEEEKKKPLTNGNS